MKFLLNGEGPCGIIASNGADHARKGLPALPAKKELNFDDAPSFLQDFLSYMLTIRGKSRNTVQEYFYDLRLLLRFLKSRDLSETGKDLEAISISGLSVDFIRSIALSDLYAFMTYLSASRFNSPHARARRVASIKSFFRYLHKKARLIETNPADELETPKIPKTLPRHLTLDESKDLLGSVDGEFLHRDYAILVLFLNCGLRLTELAGINLQSIKGDTLVIIGKGNKERSIYLNSASLEAIDAYLKERPTEGVKDRNALFLSKQKRRLSNNMIYRIVRRAIVSAGLDPEKYSVHKLRHTAATLMYKYGKVEIRTLQEILGHESIATTEIYTHLDKDQLRDAVRTNPLSDVRFKDREK
jgi:site-specific recombinase XerD